MTTTPEQALVFARHGDPREVCQLETRSYPSPRSGEVLVKMSRSPINPSDQLFVRGTYGIGPTLPAVGGFEGVGRVVASGGGIVGSLMKGKRVAVLSRAGGCWATHCVTDAKTVIPVPSNLTDEQAASFFINPATALLMTQYLFSLPAESWLMQSAAGSAVGRMIIRLGHHFGFRTLNLVRRAEQGEELRQFGADATLVVDDSTDPAEFRSQVAEICGGRAPQHAVDPVGGHVGTCLLEALGDCGKILHYGSLSEQPVTFSPRRLIERDVQISSFWLGRAMQDLSLPKKLAFIRRLTRLHEQQLFQVEEFDVYPLSRAEEAFTAAAQAPGGRKIQFQLD